MPGIVCLIQLLVSSNGGEVSLSGTCRKATMSRMNRLSARRLSENLPNRRCDTYYPSTKPLASQKGCLKKPKYLDTAPDEAF